MCTLPCVVVIGVFNLFLCTSGSQLGMVPFLPLRGHLAMLERFLVVTV